MGHLAGNVEVEVAQWLTLLLHVTREEIEAVDPPEVARHHGFEFHRSSPLVFRRASGR
jgi:hypothetical protein